MCFSLKKMENINTSTSKVNWQSKRLMLNEKELASVLGVTEYRVRQMRLKQDLPCITDKEQHQIYYYLPVVDEYFRARSKPYRSESEEPTVTENAMATDMKFSLTDLQEPAHSKQFFYKTMEPV